MAEADTPKRTDPADEFVERLQKLKAQNRGGMAILRRNAGETIETSRGAAAIFFPLLPIGARYEEVYFLVATLYGLNRHTHAGNFGRTMREVKERGGRASIDMRMKVLLDSTFDKVRGGGELAYRLRQAVKLAASKEVGVNWAQLIRDLSQWSDEWSWVRKKWARSYYGQEKPQNAEAGVGEGGISDAN